MEKISNWLDVPAVTLVWKMSSMISAYVCMYTGMYVWACVHACMYALCVCVCVWERERDRDRQTDRHRDTERERWVWYTVFRMFRMYYVRQQACFKAAVVLSTLFIFPGDHACINLDHMLVSSCSCFQNITHAVVWNQFCLFFSLYFHMMESTILVHPSFT